MTIYLLFSLAVRPEQMQVLAIQPQFHCVALVKGTNTRQARDQDRIRVGPAGEPQIKQGFVTQIFGVMHRRPPSRFRFGGKRSLFGTKTSDQRLFQIIPPAFGRGGG